MIIRPEES